MTRSQETGVPVFKRRKPDGTLVTEPGDPPAGHQDPEAPAQAVPQAASPADAGLGVPPFRPAPPKEAPAMSRPPFPTNPSAPPAPPSSSTATPRPGPGMAPGGLGARPPSRDGSERRTLVVGRGISVQGSVQDAERLVVEGTVEATMIRAAELSVAPGGVFRGEVEGEEAELAGTIDGTLVAHGTLVVRASGKLLGSARCRRLQVEDGGQISGRLEMLTDGSRGDAPRGVPGEPVKGTGDR